MDKKIGRLIFGTKASCNYFKLKDYEAALVQFLNENLSVL